MSSSVLLGVVDEEVKGRQTDWSVNKIGGFPDWCVSDVTAPLCGNCGRPCRQVCQVYCPLEGSPYHRTLHLLACCQSTCWNRDNSWCVIRCQFLENNAQYDTKHSSQGMGWGVDSSDWTDKESTNLPTEMSSGWCEGADDWGDEDECMSAKDLCGAAQDSDVDRNSDVNKMPAEESVLRGLSEMTMEEDVDGAECIPECIAEPLHVEAEYMTQLLSSRNKASDSPTTANPVATTTPSDLSSQGGVVLNSYFINVSAEPPTGEDTSSHHIDQLLRDYTSREGVNLDDILTAMPSAKGGGGEAYEKARVQHGDKLFHKFTKQVARFPQQILRYSWNGKALPLRSLDQTQVPCCSSCGAPSVFELQLMPGLVPLLKTSTGENAVEFGTVLIYTCQASCWNSEASYRSEQIVVQEDPDQHLFK